MSGFSPAAAFFPAAEEFFVCLFLQIISQVLALL